MRRDEGQEKYCKKLERGKESSSKSANLLTFSALDICTACFSASDILTIKTHPVNVFKARLDYKLGKVSNCPWAPDT